MTVMARQPRLLRVETFDVNAPVNASAYRGAPRKQLRASMGYLYLVASSMIWDALRARPGVKQHHVAISTHKPKSAIVRWLI